MGGLLDFPAADEVPQRDAAGIVLLRRVILKLLKQEAERREELIGKLLDGAEIETGEHSLELEWRSVNGARQVWLVMDGRPLEDVRLE